MASDDLDDREATHLIAVPVASEQRAALAAGAQRRPMVASSANAPAVLKAVAEQLLPAEYITFATRPHPVVMVRPLVALAAIALGLAYALTVHIHPTTVAGHYLDRAWLDARWRWLALGIAGLAGLRTLLWLAVEMQYFAGYGVVATNRRVFVASGVLRRRVKPLGNTAMASATLIRSWLGSMVGYGSVAMPSETIRDVREPGALYRETQAVANGVDGDRWDPAIRQTIIP